MGLFGWLRRTTGFVWRRIGDASVLAWLFPSTWASVVAALVFIGTSAVGMITNAAPVLWIPSAFAAAIGALLVVRIFRSPHKEPYEMSRAQAALIEAERKLLKEKRVASTQRPLPPNWPMRELFQHLAPGLSKNDENTFNEIASKILDALSTRQLDCWGREIVESRRSPLVEIDSEYWRHAKLIPWLLDKGDAGKIWQAGPSSTKAPLQQQYADLHVNRAQALAALPTPPNSAKAEFASLQDAARRVYELAERDDWLDVVANRNSTPEMRLSTFLTMFLVEAAEGTIELYGKRPPSTQSRPIPSFEIRQLRPHDSESRLLVMTPRDQTAYAEVIVSTEDVEKVAATYAAHALNDPRR